jgi:hypothetical protein
MVRVDQLQEIAALPSPILSLCLNTRSENASRHPQAETCLAWLRKKAASSSRTLLPRDAERFREQVRRIEGFLHDRHPEEKALAIFSGPKTWMIIPLQIAVENELAWGRPSISQLHRLLHEHKPCCIIAVDHHAARFFAYSLGELTELARKEFEVDRSQWKKKSLGHLTSGRIQSMRGPYPDRFDHRMEAQYARFCGETAEQAVALSKQYGLAPIFLAGPDRLIGLIQAKVPHVFGELVLLVPDDLGKFSPTQILRRLQPVIDDCQRKQQVEAVTHLLGVDHGAVFDVDETLAQLQKGAIRTFVLARDLDLHLLQCVKCGWANRSADPVCATCGAQRRKVALREYCQRCWPPTTPGSKS